MSKISTMLEAGKRHVNEERQYYEDRIAQLGKRLSRIRRLASDPYAFKENPEQMARLIKSITWGYEDIRRTIPIE